MRLLLDKTNLVWGITKSGGQVLGVNYFELYNIEAKSVGLYCGSFLGIFGLCFLGVFILNEQKYRADQLKPEDLIPIRTRNLILFGSIGGYLIFCFIVVFPLLSGKVPNFILPIIWVAGAGLIANRLATWFRNHPPKQ